MTPCKNTITFSNYCPTNGVHLSHHHDVDSDKQTDKLIQDVYPTAFAKALSSIPNPTREAFLEVCSTIVIELSTGELTLNVKELIEDKETPQPNETPSTKKPTGNSVFVVHGRNLIVKDQVENAIRAMKIEIISWDDAEKLHGDPNPWNGDVVEAGMNHSRAVVVIFTGDDEAKLKEEFFKIGLDNPDEIKPQSQPRPNVLFEAGMAIGKDLGNEKKRVVIVEDKEHRRISDIEGKNTVRLTNNYWIKKLGDRLELAGCEVDKKSLGKYIKQVADSPNEPNNGSTNPSPEKFRGAVAGKRRVTGKKDSSLDFLDHY